MWRRRGRRRKKAESYQHYYFRILKEQGAHAPGGAKSYLVNGKMTKGYALAKDGGCRKGNYRI
jgi:hypothetical protein